MAREDKILKSFLSDPILKDKYNVDPDDFATVDKAMNSKIPIVKAIAILIRGTDTDADEKASYQQVVNFLNRNVK